MIKHLGQKLRTAGLADNLIYDLELRPGTAHWLARLGIEVAEGQNRPLAALKGPAQLDAFFTALKMAGYHDLLDAIAADAPLFAARLATTPDGDDGLPLAA